MNKKQQDLENVPEAEVEYSDLSAESLEFITTTARIAYSNKAKGASLFPLSVSCSRHPQLHNDVKKSNN